MKDQVFGVLQRIGRSFMLPIALLPAAGLLLGIGGSFSNVTMLKAYGLTRIMGPGTFWNALFMVMSRAGDIVFTNLPILFAMGVAIGMAKKEKEVAALAAVISFLVMHAAIGAMIEVNGGADSLKEGAGAMVAGIWSLQMGVFGGILVGLGRHGSTTGIIRSSFPRCSRFSAERGLSRSCAPCFTFSWGSSCTLSGRRSRRRSPESAGSCSAPVTREPGFTALWSGR